MLALHLAVFLALPGQGMKPIPADFGICKIHHVDIGSTSRDGSVYIICNAADWVCAEASSCLRHSETA